MPFRCPACQQETLRITDRLELPPDRNWDEISLQVVECLNCGFSAAAFYRETRRGALDSEVVDQRGFRLPTGQLKALRSSIRRCPKPGSPRCHCAAHRRWSARDELGNWTGLDEVDYRDFFGMEYIP